MLTSTTIWIIVGVAIALVLIALVVGSSLRRRRRIDLVEPEKDTPHASTYQADSAITFTSGDDRRIDGPGAVGTDDVEAPPEGGAAESVVVERPEPDGAPGVGEDATPPRDVDGPGSVRVTLPEPARPGDQVAPPSAVGTPDSGATAVVPEQLSPSVEAASTEFVEPAEGRLERLRGRLAGSRSAFGQSLLGLLGAGDLDEESWEDVEATLLKADLGAAMTTELVERLRAELAASGARDADEARVVLREVLISALRPEMDRAVRALPRGTDGDRTPGVVLVVGVNGTGKTTTTGKLARVLIGSGRRVVLGAADTFRAAAADQLATWAQRVGAEVVRGKEGADPAAVAFDAVKQGTAVRADTVLVDTAGRLHTKTGLMDELGKVKRVVEKQAVVDEVLLVLDATTGQNGVVQAKVFGEVVEVTGIVLTKLDGTAKGGIVFRVQRELGVPVKLVGLGEGPDDLAPFEPAAFVDALLD